MVVFCELCQLVSVMSTFSRLFSPPACWPAFSCLYLSLSRMAISGAAFGVAFGVQRTCHILLPYDCHFL